MPFTKEYPAMPTVTTPPCIHLRNKAMYIRGIPGQPETYPEETNVPYCWCNITQHFYGPDAAHVTREKCVPGRECYKETY